MDLTYRFDRYTKLSEDRFLVNETSSEDEKNFLMDVWFGTACFLTVFGLLSNILLLIAIKKSPRLKAPIFQLKFAIAFSDIILLVAFALPDIADKIGAGKWVLGRSGCTLIQFLQYLPPHVASCLITVCCWERFYAVCRPHSTLGWVTSRRMSGIIAVIWILNAGLLIPIVAYSKPIILQYSDGSTAAACQLKMPSDANKIYFTIMGMIFYGVTAIVSLAFSVSSICKACKVDLENYFIKDDFKNHIMRCVVVITVLTIILWLPYRYAYFSNLHLQEPVSNDLLILANLMVLLCGSIKPCVYVFASSQFKKAVIRALKCCERESYRDLQQTHGYKMHEHFLPPETELL